MDVFEPRKEDLGSETWLTNSVEVDPGELVIYVHKVEYSQETEKNVNIKEFQISRCLVPKLA